MERFKINDRIKIVGKNVKGKVVFVGETHFADGTLYGVAMDDPIGRHDGIMNGVRYFKCKENHGIFVKACQLQNVGNGIERSRGLIDSTTKKKSSNGSNQETNKPSEKQNCIIETARKSSATEIGSKMHDYSQPCPQRKFKLKPKEQLTTQGQTKNTTISARKSFTALNGSKVRADPPKKFRLKSKERLATGDQINIMTERENEPNSNDKNFIDLKSKECGKLKEEIDILNNEINYKDGQLATLQSELSRLKSCIHWSRKFSNSNSFKDINLKRFFTQEIDVRIKNMEDTIKNPDEKQTVGRYKDYKTLKEHNRFLQLYVVDLEKQTEVLMDTILRIRGIVLKEKKKQRSDPKGSNQNYLQKHVGKFFKDIAFSSQVFTDEEMAGDSSRLSPSSFDRDLESLAETIPNANKEESEIFETGTSQKQRKSSLDKNVPPKSKKEDAEKYAASIPDSEDYYMASTYPEWHETFETKISNKSQAKKRYDPYPRNLFQNKGKEWTIASSKELSSKFDPASKKLSRPKLNYKNAPLFARRASQYEFLNLFGANKQVRKVPSKPKAPSGTILAKGKKSAIRSRGLKKKSLYSMHVPIRK